MSKNLDAVIRYRVINKCLRNKFKKFPTKEELKDACEETLGCEVSERTIDKDIYEMRHNDSLGYFAPIKYDKKTKGYSYTDPNYSIDSIPIGSSDLNAIEFAAEILGQYKDVNILNEFKGAVDKIVDTVKVQRLIYDQPSLSGVIQLDKLEYVRGAEFLNDLIEFVRSKKTILLSYQKFGVVDPKEYSFNPYMLKEYNGLWYVTGLVTEYESIRTFALDRIVSLKSTNEFFEVIEGFDREVYYNHVFGVTHTDRPPEKVIIKTNQGTAQYLVVTPLHKSQVIIREDADFVWFGYDLVLNYELETKLLSLGDGCVVEEPITLKESIKQRFINSLKNYE